MNNKLVTILVVVYNHEKFIDDCIFSILNQTYKNIEVIITDDCSPDGSYKKALEWEEKLKERFERVHIVQTPHNLGAIKNVNSALKYVTGYYFKWIDSDDMLLPDAIENMVRFLDNHPDFAMLYSNYMVCSENQKYIDLIKSKGEIYKPKADIEEKSYAQALYEFDFIIAPATMVRWNVMNEIGYFDENIGIGDWGTWIDIALRHEIGYLDQATAIYRIVGNSMSRFTMDENGRKRLRYMVENEIKVLDKFKNHPSIKPESGIKACCEQGISVAIDLGADDIIQMIKKYAAQNNISISMEMSIKFFLYKIHILKMVQWIKRKMKLETNMIQ